jgi:hypothetical protein
MSEERQGLMKQYMFFLMVTLSVSLVGMDEKECKLPGMLDLSFLNEYDQPNIKKYFQQKYEAILQKIRGYAGKRISATSTCRECIKILSPKDVLVVIKELVALSKSMQSFCKVLDPVNVWDCYKQFYELNASIVQMLYDIRNIMGWRLIQFVNGLKLQSPVVNVAFQNFAIKNPKVQQQLFLEWYSFLSKNKTRFS